MIPSLSRWLAPIRAGTWWEYKTPILLGIIYATALTGGVPFTRVWPALVACVAALIPLASYVCVINDITDERDDLRAGKSNRMAGKPAAFKAAWLAACLAGCCLAGWWCFQGNAVAAGFYAANWLAFTLYSVPPIRLKSRGLAGVIADASGGTLLPSLWSALLADSAAPPAFLAAVAVWAAAFGLRSILYHQAGDVEHDREAGVGTLAVRLGRRRIAWLVTFLLFPVECVGLAAMLWMTGTPYAIPLLGIYGFLQAAMWLFLQVPTVLVLPQGPHRFALLQYYQLWFPLTGILGLADRDWRAIGLIAVHMVLFPETWWRFPGYVAKLAEGAWLWPGQAYAGPSATAAMSGVAASSTDIREAPACDLHWAGSLPGAHARYAEARERGTVCYDANQNCWCVLGYDAAVDCLRDPATFSNDPVADFDPFVVGGDPPEHGRFRRILHDSIRDFDREAVVAFCGPWLDRFISRIGSGSEFDAVADLAVPLVDDLAGWMVGLRPEEIAHFAELRPANRTDVRRFDDSAWDFFSGIVAQGRPEVRDGALRVILEQRHDGSLTDRQAVSLLRLLWIGSTATSNLFNPSALMLLLRHPELQSRLREGPALVPAFVAESLRLEGPTTVVPRRVITDIEFHGVRMRKDDLVSVCLLAANSDPAAFPSPGTIDLDRPAGRHIAFGLGIHHCLGATVARHVAETVVDRLVRCLPSMRSAEPLDHLAYEQGNLRGLTRLRICVP